MDTQVAAATETPLGMATRRRTLRIRAVTGLRILTLGIPRRVASRRVASRRVASRRVASRRERAPVATQTVDPYAPGFVQPTRSRSHDSRGEGPGPYDPAGKRSRRY